MRTLPSTPNQSFNSISLVVDDEYHDFQLLLNHSPNLLDRKRHTPIARYQDCPPLLPIHLLPRDIHAERSSGSIPDTTVVHLSLEPDISGISDIDDAKICGAGFANEDVTGAEEGLDLRP